jgi:uncharacterized protein YndB with AHSA1/START domain
MKWLRFAGLTLLVMLLLAIFLLWVARFRPGAGTGSHSVEIDRPPQVVWPWLREPEKMKSWVSWLVAVEPDPTSPEGVGHRTVLTMEDRNNGNQRMRLPTTTTEWDPPHRLAAHIVYAGLFDGDQRYILTPLPGGRTRFTIESRFHYGQWFANLMEPVITPQAGKKLADDMARLKSLVEAEPAVAAAAK